MPKPSYRDIVIHALTSKSPFSPNSSSTSTPPKGGGSEGLAGGGAAAGSFRGTRSLQIIKKIVGAELFPSSPGKWSNYQSEKLMSELNAGIEEGLVHREGNSFKWIGDKHRLKPKTVKGIRKIGSPKIGSPKIKSKPKSKMKPKPSTPGKRSVGRPRKASFSSTPPSSSSSEAVVAPLATLVAAAALAATEETEANASTNENTENTEPNTEEEKGGEGDGDEGKTNAEVLALMEARNSENTTPNAEEEEEEEKGGDGDEGKTNADQSETDTSPTKPSSPSPSSPPKTSPASNPTNETSLATVIAETVAATKAANTTQQQQQQEGNGDEETPQPSPAPRKRGRPRKNTVEAAVASAVVAAASQKRGRGRPRSVVPAVASGVGAAASPKRGRGRPRKHPLGSTTTDAPPSKRRRAITPTHVLQLPPGGVTWNPFSALVPTATSTNNTSANTATAAASRTSVVPAKSTRPSIFQASKYNSIRELTDRDEEAIKAAARQFADGGGQQSTKPNQRQRRGAIRNKTTSSTSLTQPGDGWTDGAIHPLMYTATSKEGRMSLYTSQRRLIGRSRAWSRTGGGDPNDAIATSSKQIVDPSNETTTTTTTTTTNNNNIDPDEEANNIRALTCQLSERFYKLGWKPGTGGGISFRIGNGSPSSPYRVFSTPSGLQREDMIGDDVFELDMEQNVTRAPITPGLGLSSMTSLWFIVYNLRPSAMCVIHTHSMNALLVTMLEELTLLPPESDPASDIGVIRCTHLEMIKGVGNHAYDSTLTVPVIPNRSSEDRLGPDLERAIRMYPKCNAVLVRRHGVYVWGDSWEQAKTQLESFDYLFGCMVELKKMGIDCAVPPRTKETEKENGNGNGKEKTMAVTTMTSTTTVVEEGNQGEQV